MYEYVPPIPSLDDTKEFMEWLFMPPKRGDYGKFPFDDFGMEWDGDGRPFFVYGDELTREHKKYREVTHTFLPNIIKLYKDLHVVYNSCAITTGIESFHYALKNKELLETVADEKGRYPTKDTSTLFGSPFADTIIQRNVDRNIYSSLLLAGLPENEEKLICPPVFLEGFSLGQGLYSNTARLGHLKFDEVAFMTIWYPWIAHVCKEFNGNLDYALSRNGALELSMATTVQAGLVPSRHGDTMSVKNFDGSEKTLYQRALEIYKALNFGVSNNFKMETQSTVLTRLFFLDDLLKENIKPEDFEFDKDRAHKTLKRRDPEEEVAMEELKKLASPLLYERCRDYTNMNCMPKNYIRDLLQRTWPEAEIASNGIITENAPPQPEPIELKIEDFKLDKDEYRQYLERYQSYVKRVTGRDSALLSGKPETLAMPGRSGNNKNYYNPFYEAVVNHALSRNIVRTIVHSSMFTISSRDQNFATVVLQDKYNNHWGTKLADELDIPYQGILSEESLKDRKVIEEEVIKPALNQAAAISDQIRSEKPSRLIYTIETLKDIDKIIKASNIDNERGLPIELQSHGRYLAMSEYIRLYADEVIFGKDWATKPPYAILMVQAILTRMGSNRRPKEIYGQQLSIKQITDSKMSNIGMEEVTIDSALLDISKVIVREATRYNQEVSDGFKLAYLQLDDLKKLIEDPQRNKGEFSNARYPEGYMHLLAKGHTEQEKAIIEQAEEIILETLGQCDEKFLHGLDPQRRDQYYQSQGKYDVATKSKRSVRNYGVQGLNRR